MNDKIIIKGARENNLKNINLTIPRDKLIVFTGLSGSGKSSLAFDTIYAAFGISGIETSFAFAVTYLYKTGVLSLPEIAEKMSAAPARILGLDGGKIVEGGVADLMIADLDEKWVVEPAKFLSKGKNSPFEGYELCGVVKYTIVDGEIKYQE